MNVRQACNQLNWFLSSQLGIDLRRLGRSVRGVPSFLRDLRQFRSGSGVPRSLKPCLHDRYEEAGFIRFEYFWQDLIVARRIHAACPRRHIDVGSRIDGFVAHVAAFRDIEVLDVRAFASRVPGVTFRQVDLASPEPIDPLFGSGFCDSLSCLHALEHFGLGRYGDPVDPDGPLRGIANMARLLEPSGTLYLSTPVGRERVCFNANWIFDPLRLVRSASDVGLILDSLVTIGPEGILDEPPPSEASLSHLGRADYRLTLFTFRKVNLARC